MPSLTCAVLRLGFVLLALASFASTLSAAWVDFSETASPALGFPTVAYDENEVGDLSGDFSNPTSITLLLGLNSVFGNMGNNGNSGATNGQDADYFTFTIPAGYSLTEMTINRYDSPGDPNVSFGGFAIGSSFTGQGSGDIDGQVLFNGSSGNILDDFLGNSDPLGPGTYSIWLQETSNNTLDYSIALNVVPEPSTWLTMAGGVLGLGFVLRRRLR